MTIIRVGTRSSQLAQAQTKLAIAPLAQQPDLSIEIKNVSTRGDLDLQTPLAEFNETGVFTKELEQLLLRDEIDLAVHSLKDLPLQPPAGLSIVAIPPRARALDTIAIQAQAVEHRASIVPVQHGAIVGTGSARRAAILSALRPDLKIKPIRGNINTRIKKLSEGEYNAVLFAAAGLERINFKSSELILSLLEAGQFPPAPGQGALALQMRTDHPLLARINELLNHDLTTRCVQAERHLLSLFGGGCSLPLGILVEPVLEGFRCSAFFDRGNSPRWVQLTTDDPVQGVKQIYQQLNG